MRGARGFTLLEVLVALAILAIALTAATRAIGVATSQAEDIRERLVAQWVAENILAEHRVRGQWIDAGASSDGEVEQAGFRMRWHEDVKATPNPLFRRVEVQVYRVGDDSQLASFTGFLARAAP